MYHQHQLVKPHMDAVADEIRRDRRQREVDRGSLLTGARIHGSTPALIGDRVVILDPCRDNDLQLAA